MAATAIAPPAIWKEKVFYFVFCCYLLDSGKKGSGKKGKQVDGFSDLNPG